MNAKTLPPCRACGKAPEVLRRTLARAWFYARRFVARVTSPRSDGLFFCSGDWRVIYPDGRYSVFMEYGNAADYREVFGGTIEWRYDREKPE